MTKAHDSPCSKFCPECGTKINWEKHTGQCNKKIVNSWPSWKKEAIANAFGFTYKKPHECENKILPEVKERS